MSKPSSKSKRRSIADESRTKPASDRTIYIGFIVIGAFIAFLAAILTDGVYWPHACVAYLAIVAFFVHHCAMAIYRGRHDLAGWERALARLPLRCAGYGAAGGKPIEASHGDPRARRMIITSAVISIVIIGALAAWLLLGDGG